MPAKIEALVPFGIATAGEERSGGEPWRWALRLLALAAAFGGVLALATYGPPALAAVNRALFGPQSAVVPVWVSRFFGLYFQLSIWGAVFPFLLFATWAGLAPRRPRRRRDAPPVSIVIPAFNEERSIRRSLRAALTQDYPDYEVIVVDDGSTDLTPALVESAGVTYVRLKRNRGKAAALNAGLERAKGEIVVFSDSDSRLHPEALRRLVSRFADREIGAVAGTVVPGRPRGYLRRCQLLEYLAGQDLMKLAQVGSGSSITLCPGPVCAYRRDLLLRLGGFSERTLVEDYDATLEVVASGHRVLYEPRATATTDAPFRWSVLHRQRLRWSRGNLQIFRRHRALMLSPRAGMAGLVWLPYAALFAYGGTVLQALALATLPGVLLASGMPLATLTLGVAYVALIEVLLAFQYLLVLGRLRAARPALVATALVIQPYRLFLAWVRLEAMVHELLRTEKRWAG